MRHINVSKCPPLGVSPPRPPSCFSTSQMKIRGTPIIDHPSLSLTPLRPPSPSRPLSHAPFYLFPPNFPTSLLYIGAGRVSKALSSHRCVKKDKLDVIRFVDCVHVYTLL